MGNENNDFTNDGWSVEAMPAAMQHLVECADRFLLSGCKYVTIRVERAESVILLTTPPGRYFSEMLSMKPEGLYVSCQYVRKRKWRRARVRVGSIMFMPWHEMTMLELETNETWNGGAVA